MARGGYGGRQGAGILGKPTSSTESKLVTGAASLQTRTKLCLVVALACVVAYCAYAFSVIAHQCSRNDHAASNGTVDGVMTPKLAPYHGLSALGVTDDPGMERDASERLDKGGEYTKRYNTSLENVVFGIAASAKLWEKRKQYVRQWWRPTLMRGYVWLDAHVNGTWDRDVPPFRISANTSQFKYSRQKGNRAALRLSRIVTETFRIGLKHVDWFVMGDDDTVFFTDNLVRVLSNYDPKQMHYIGSQSESHVQNTLFSYEMAYGGGGFAISYPLAKALAATHDGCLHRYPELFGSDDRMHACITELGVPITKNQGFHQFDIYGDPMGLLAAHPMTPLLSVHHLDVIGSLSPKKNRLAALRQFVKAARVDEASMAQQTITYAKRRKYSFSISAGYVVRVYRGFMPPRQLEEVPRTFYSWYGSKNGSHFPFNVREIPDEPCQKPTLFVLSERTAIKTNTTSSTLGLIETVYQKQLMPALNLTRCNDTLSSVERILVRGAPLNHAPFEPRRLCGTIATWVNNTIEIDIRPCKQGELVIGPD
ncbi:hypothetical protein M758_UG099100 [Ceratodon purpureus]|nr:hypothetical protein M758_UG099100 [Ceratodon purpureus]